MNETHLRELLRDAPLPDRDGAEERAWRVTRAAFEERRPQPEGSGRPRLRVVVAVALGALITAALALTPAGARVGELIDDVVSRGDRDARTSLTSLPAPGQLLVESDPGPWVVHRDGSKRLLGAYAEASWAPRGRFATVTRGGQLIAVVADPDAVGEPAGTVRWSVTRGADVRDPVWSSRGLRAGFRVAYRGGGSVRTVSGTGTDDRLVDTGATPVAPAWRPGAEHVLAYARRDGSVRAVDADSEVGLWSTPRLVGSRVKGLSWSPSGARLLIAMPSLLLVVDAAGRPRLKWDPGRVQDAGFSPAADRVAVIRARSSARLARSELVLLDRLGDRPRERILLREPERLTDLTWSPDGEWLLVAAPDTDRWLFVRPADGQTITMSGIARLFDPGTRKEPRFPRVSGWCCPP